MEKLITNKSLKNKLFGDKAFYKMVLAVAVPIMVQNGITNFVNLLDNIMIGKIGTEEMTGPAIVNTMMFVFNLCIFGGLAGAGIFTSQFFGMKNNQGVQQTFRFKIWIGIIILTFSILLLVFFQDTLISLYLNGSNEGGQLDKTLKYGKQYLYIMLFGLPAFVLTQIYTGTLRECGETVLPMVAGLIAIGINLIFNYLLIFGNFGFPRLGVEGAAIATVLSRFVEAIIVLVYSHCNTKKHSYFKKIYCSVKVPLELAGKIFIKGFPLFLNEAMWACGVAMLSRCYSLRGLDVVAGLNIANTLNNVFNVVFIALGIAVGIIVGQLLGADKLEEAKDTDRKMIVFSVLSCIVMALLMIIVAPFFPKIYGTTENVKQIATKFLILQSVFMPQGAFLHASYFTLRSGGKTLITFIFDGGFMWIVSIPLAVILSKLTNISVFWIFIYVQIADWIKCIIGYVLVKKGSWVNNIVRN